jgi:internalin A
MERRLVKIAKELNVGTTTLVEFLHKNGYEIENRPTAWVSDEVHTILLKEFQLARYLIEENKRTKDPYLDLGNCGLSQLPPELKECVWIEVLTLSNEWEDYNWKTQKWETKRSKNSGVLNRISSISGIEHLKNLKILVLKRGIFDKGGKWPLSDLMPLSGLTTLQELSISGTAVEILDPISGLENLKRLDIFITPVSDLNPLSELTSLEIIGLGGANKISSLSPLSKLTNLRMLQFGGTSVTNLEPLTGLTNLKVLICRNSMITDLSPIANLVNLEEFDCSDNQVVDLVPLATLSHLKHLKCESTLAKKIEPIAKIPSLVSFSCYDCPIEDCPADVYETGDIKVLRAYFERKKTEQTDVDNSRPVETKTLLDDRPFDVKLILLGNSNAGKTNLLHYLKTGQYLGDRNSTHGLEVHRWLPDSNRFPMLKDVAVSIWDFGGQEYYHEAYRLFMSANAVYLLLWDVETDFNGRYPTCLKDGEPEVDLEHFELRYWLDTVRHYGGKDNSTPLLVAQNKTDLNGKKRIPQELHDGYNIAESFHFSLQNGCNQASFSRDGYSLRHFDVELQEVLCEKKDNASLPSDWQKIRACILEMHENRGNDSNPFARELKADGSLSIKGFEKACEALLERPLSEDERGKTLPKIMDRGGVVAYFEKLEAMKGLVFLKPAELTERIYEVLNERVLILKGEFTLRDVFDNTADGEFQKVFIEATQSMGLVFPHPSKDKPGYFIAPQYLSETHPIEDLFKIASYGVWESSIWVRVPLFYYKKVLHGLVQYYIKDKDTEARYFWKHGIFFLKNGLRVLIKGLYPAEHEHEGIVLIAVERNFSTSLQKEIFNQIRILLSPKKENPEQTGSTSSNLRTVPADPNKIRLHRIASTEQILSSPDWLEVSHDGKYFVKYSDLDAAAKNEEVKITATSTAGDQERVLIRLFEPLLDRPPKHAKRVFFSYSHLNTHWLGRLRAHLSGLRRSNDIETWDDQEILPGDEWNKVVKDKLKEADVFILLLSADFIASNYIWDVELKTAIKGFKDNGKRVIPILVEPLDLGGLPGVDDAGTKIQGFEIVPKNKNEHLLAVSLWANHEEALAEVAKRIRAAVKDKSE